MQGIWIPGSREEAHPGMTMEVWFIAKRYVRCRNDEHKKIPHPKSSLESVSKDEAGVTIGACEYYSG